MSSYTLSTSEIPRHEFHIPTLPMNRSLVWLKQGWSDLAARPGLGLAYGALIALVGFWLSYGLNAQGLFYLVPVFTAGFLIIAPLLTVALYADAKQREHPDPEQARSSGAIIAKNISAIGQMGVVLMLFFINWIMLSNLLFGGVFSGLMPTWTEVSPLTEMWSQSLPFVAVYAAIGVALAALVFRMAAVSIPMMVDQNVDVFNAMFASWKAVGENAGAMAVWSLVIVGLCLVGFATFFVGFVVIMPLLGYASWHAYKDTLQSRGS